MWTDSYSCSDNESYLTAVIRINSTGWLPSFPPVEVPTEIKLPTC